MDTEFQALVENAVDFLERSVHDLQAGASKYSVIHFYSGLELMLKARLLYEHWSLCASDVDKADKARFAVGDFESIGLKEARDRLANVLNCKLADSENRAYEKLRKRRNQAVHFFHPEDVSSTKRLALEQLVGWHFLYQRVSVSWKDCFASYSTRLANLHRVIRGYKEYAPSVYKEREDEFRKRSRREPLAVCDSCMQHSAFKTAAILDSLYLVACEVCSNEVAALFLPCGRCGKASPRSYGESAPCQFCEFRNPSFVEESFKWAEKNQLQPPSAWCACCGYTPRESVTAIGRSSFCLACHQFHSWSDIKRCEQCGDLVTGEVNPYSSAACFRDKQYILKEIGEAPMEDPEFLFSAADRKRMKEWAAD